MSILVLIEHNQGEITKSSLSAVKAASLIGNNITVLAVGSEVDMVVKELITIDNIEKILINKSPVYNHGKAESIALLLAEIGKNYTHIISSTSVFAKNILARVAGLLDVGAITEVTEIINDKTFVRPIYAGNALTTVESTDTIKIITIRASAFSPAKLNSTASVPIEELTQVFEFNQSYYLSENLKTSERPELMSASIVVTGGRGLQSAENFNNLIGALADKLHAAIGATRAAVDAGYVDNDFQIGQTGKIVAPELYIAIGVSGAIQHLAGMRESKIIVAINRDADAPIMKIADYALQADLFEVIPELINFDCT